MKLILTFIFLVCSASCGCTAPPTIIPATGGWRTIFNATTDVDIKDPPYEANDFLRKFYATEADWERRRTELNSVPPIPAKLHHAAGNLVHFTFMADDLAALSAPASIPDLRTLVTCAFANTILQPKSLTHWQSICAADYSAAVAQGKLGPVFCWEEKEIPLPEGLDPVHFHDSGVYRWPVLWAVPTSNDVGIARDANGKWECVITGVLEHSGIFTALASISRFSLDPAFNGYLCETSNYRDYEFFHFPISFVEESGQLKLRDIGGPNPSEEQVETMRRLSGLVGASFRRTLTEYPLGLREHLPPLLAPDP